LLIFIFVVECRSISRDVGAAGRLIYKDVRVQLIVPFQVAFGFASSMIVFYVMGTVIADSPYLGKEYVGFLAALVVGMCITYSIFALIYLLSIIFYFILSCFKSDIYYLLLYH
jgi:hypothetical protein